MDEDLPISELPLASSSTGTDLIPIVQGGITKRIERDNLVTPLDISGKEDKFITENKSATFTAYPHRLYFVDTTSGDVTIHPVSISSVNDGDRFIFISQSSNSSIVPSSMGLQDSVTAISGEVVEYYADKITNRWNKIRHEKVTATLLSELGVILVEDAIVNGVTDKAPSQNVVYDGLAGKQDTLTASNTHTFIDSLTAMTTPVDADRVLIVDNSTSLSKKITLINLWTNYIKVNVGNTFGLINIIPNYYKVDLNSGSDSFGVAGRQDLPFLTIQTVWDLIATSSTAQIIIEIVGDYTFTTHAINTSINKDNVTFLFKGKITYAIPATTTSRPLFTFSGTNNNLTFIVPNYAQTTQGGFIYSPSSSGFRFIVDDMQILLGVSTSIVTNVGFRCLAGTNEQYFQCNNLTVNITNDVSAIRGYQYPLIIVNCNYRITTLKITGTSTVASTSFSLINNTAKSIYIENLIANNTYSNLIDYNICSGVSCDNVTVNSISISAGGQSAINTNFILFEGTINNLTIMNGYILNYSIITDSTTTIENLNLGNLTITGIIQRLYTQKNINLLGNIIRTVSAQSNFSLICLGQNGQVNGNGFKIYHTDPIYLSSSAIIICSSNGVSTPKAQFINDLTIYNTNMATGGTQAFVPIFYYLSLGTLRLRNLVVYSNIDTNSHANTSFIRPYGENTTYVYRIEGNVATNYLQNVNNLTNNADIDLISGYIL